MITWKRIKSFGMETLQWWEVIVKPGIVKLAKSRSKQITRERKEELNLLLVRQAYLNKKVKLGNFDLLGDLQDCSPSNPALVSASLHQNQRSVQSR